MLRTSSRLWCANDVVAHGDGLERSKHPELGLLELEFPTFAVDGRPELGMIVYNPTTAQDTERLRVLIARGPQVRI